MAVAAGVVAPALVTAAVAGQQLVAQGCDAAGHDGAPGLGLEGVQGVACQLRLPMAAQHLSQRGASHGGWPAQGRRSAASKSSGSVSLA